MSITSKAVRRGLRYHIQAYHFVFAALRVAQQKLGRTSTRRGSGEFSGGKFSGDELSRDDYSRDDRSREDESSGHISGPELLAGIRELAVQQFGLMTIPVFRAWGVQSTDDFGRIVFEMIERGEMRKTERDRLTDFFDVFDFEDVFDRNYRIDTKSAFRRRKGE